MTDPLADWYRHPVQVERYQGAGGYGEKWDDPVTYYGMVSDGAKLIAGPNGEQLVSVAQVAFPLAATYIPPESRVTLPPAFGPNRVHRVVFSAVGDGGGQPTPDHIEIALV